MKNLLLHYLNALLILFLANNVYAQDIITLKNGDEIKSKVLEVTTDQVKYKKWENQEGPVYSSNKSDVFMIKYVNGTKEVFDTSPTVNSNSIQTSSIIDGSKFIGTWYHKLYNGNSNQTLIIITKALENLLVEYKVHERVDEYFYSADGSFKEVGHVENGSIIINSFTKLSLLNENTILMGSTEFYRTAKNSQNQSTNSSSTTSNPYGSNKTLLETPEIHQTTTHKGFFNNEITDKPYWSGYVNNKKDMVQPSIEKNLFYKHGGLGPIERKFGKEEFYKDDKLIVKVGDTLSVILNFFGVDIKSVLYSDFLVGKGEYLMSVQVADVTGKEYFRDSWEKVVNTRSKDMMEAGTVDISIIITPEKLQSFPLSQELYLSFLLQDQKRKKEKSEGFLIFSVEQ